MKKFLVLIFAALTLCLVFAACAADADDTTKDGIVDDKGGVAKTVEKTAQNIADAVTTHTRRDVAKEVRDTVSDYYRTRLGLYGGYAGGTIGREFASGAGVSGAAYGRNLTNTTRTSNNWENIEQILGIGVVQNGYDTDANNASNISSSAQVSDPIGASGLVRSGSSNVD